MMDYFIQMVIVDANKMFKTNFPVDYKKPLTFKCNGKIKIGDQWPVNFL